MVLKIRVKGSYFQWLHKIRDKMNFNKFYSKTDIYISSYRQFWKIYKNHKWTLELFKLTFMSIIHLCIFSSENRAILHTKGVNRNKSPTLTYSDKIYSHIAVCLTMFQHWKPAAHPLSTSYFRPSTIYPTGPRTTNRLRHPLHDSYLNCFDINSILKHSAGVLV